MASQIQIQGDSGLDVYAVVRRVDNGQVWNGMTFESLSPANWSDYVVSLSEQSTTGYYIANLPAGLAAGEYSVVAYEQLGEDPASSDDPVGVGVITHGLVSNLAPATLASELAASVWDEPIAGHSEAGSTGQSLATSAIAIDPFLSFVPGEYVAGTAGHRLGLLGVGRVAISSPVSVTGDIPAMIQGDDYFSEDNRALEWTDEGESWPDLSDADVVFVAERDDVNLSTLAEVVVPSGSSKLVRVELSGNQTGSLVAGNYRFQVRATLATGHTVTLARGTMTMLERVAA